tara:strand:- start:1144 stop:2166 length:1023 start_codon:yes stop_codon:yes gene_type:complete
MIWSLLISILATTLLGTQLDANKSNLWLLFAFAACCVLESAFVLLRSWLVRKEVFLGVGIAQFIRPISFVGVALLFASLEQQKFDLRSIHLIIATTFAALTAVISMLFILKLARGGLKNISFKMQFSIDAIRKHMSMVSSVSIAQIIHQLGIQVPIWIVALQFSNIQIGWLAFAIRVTLLPVQLNNNSVASILNRKISKKIHQNEKVTHIIRPTLLLAGLAGICGYLFIYALVEWKYLSILGHIWIEAKETIQLLCLYGFSHFIFSFIRFIPISDGDHIFFLKWNIFRIVALASASLLIWIFSYDYYLTLLLFALTEMLTHTYFVVRTYLKYCTPNPSNI